MWLSTTRPDVQLNTANTNRLRLSRDQLASLAIDRWNLLYCLIAVEQVYSRAQTMDSVHGSGSYVKLTEQLQTIWSRLMLPSPGTVTDTMNRGTDMRNSKYLRVIDLTGLCSRKIFGKPKCLNKLLVTHYIDYHKSLIHTLADLAC